MLSIRSANLDDVSLLNGLIHEFAKFERLPVSITDQALVRDGFGPQPKFHALIAEWDGRAAGYALFFHHYSSFQGCAIFLEDLYVRAEFRGKNIGKPLLARVALLARESGCFSVLFNVLDWNEPAINFYRKLGAEFLDDWKTVCLKGSALQALANQGR